MDKIADSSSKIQPEIQFLRALAVSLVILGHSKFSWWSGGFVGVDMFFVVSGYVIGLSLIHERHQTNSNSLKTFFQRRFFRIYPPLAATVVGSCIYAYLILPFDRTQDYFIEQAQAALFSYANFFFIFHKLDYFLHEGSSTFFLHTWSLGIEEQFYILVPILIAIVGFRYRSKASSDHFRIWRNVFRTIALISIICALVIHLNFYTFSTPEFSRLVLFYSPLTRSWEFFTGMLIALHLSNDLRTDSQKQPSKIGGRTFLSLSIGLLLVSLIGYQQELMSQFGASSLTTVATGLFILIRTRVNLSENRFIRNRAVQTIGNASYSIYLWHWIGVSIAADAFRPNSLDPNNSLETSILILLSLIPAFLSYRIIEIPFRKVRFLSTRPKIIIGISLVLTPVMCLTLLRSTMLSAREDYGNVFPSTILKGCDFWGELCTVGSKDAPKKILIYGDSHAYQLIPMIKEYVEVNRIELTTCVKVCNDENLAKIGDGSFSERHFDLVITSISGMSSRDDRKTFASNFNLFAKSQNSLHLVVLDNPFFANHASPRRIKHPVLEPLDRKVQTEMRAPSLTELVLDSDAETIFFDPFDSLCNEEICFTEFGGKAIYLDNNHYSMAGSNLIQPNLYKTLDSLLGN
jgi:peptidoglycan/LPS O-acetylase OafA/YrhL